MYFGSKLPDDFRVRTSKENADAPIVASYTLQHLKRPSSQISVSIGKLSGSLDEVSAVKLRLSQPEVYERIQRNFAPGGITFSKQDSYETATFWQRSSQYVSLVASGTAQDRDELEKAVILISDSWQWK
jgi:hypothetical protein